MPDDGFCMNNIYILYIGIDIDHTTSFKPKAKVVSGASSYGFNVISFNQFTLEATSDF